jgi:hypothetical protein
MSRQDRLNWVADGSPFTLMRPAADLRDVLRRHGYTVYDLGDTGHLEHEPPEDHTPYSETGWPGTAKYGVGYAIDVMPPKAGQRSKIDGQVLPSLQQLGARMLADRNAGVGIGWLKYMNWEPEADWSGPCWHESWQPTYRRRSSSDRGHIHLSGLTGYETSTAGQGYDPVTRLREEEDPMAAISDADAKALIWRVEAIAAGRLAVAGGPTRGEAVAINQRAVTLEQKVNALAAVVAGVDEQTADRLRAEFAAIEAAAADRAAAQLAAMDVLRAELADDLATTAVPALVAAVRAQLGDVDQDVLTAAVTQALRDVAAQIAAPAAAAAPAAG